MSLSAIFAFLWLCLTPSIASAQTSYSYPNSTDAAFDENSNPCSNPLLRTFNVTDSFTVGDLNVGILLEHSWRSDLIITLQAPAAAGGGIVTLFNQTGGSRNNLNILLDDANANPVSDHGGNNDTATSTTTAPPWEETSYRPSSALSAFNGINANGTWTMSICDNGNSDDGTFFQANLYFTSALTNYVDLSVGNAIGGGNANTGDTITYTLTVTNSSSATQDATGVVVRDILPAGLTFVSASGFGTYNSGTGDWTVGSVPIGTTRTLTINATITAASGTTINNVAQVTAQGQTDLDSTPNNGVTTEDDYRAVAFTVGTRIPGISPTLTCPAGTSIFDWDSRTWTTGSLSNSYPLVNVGTFDIDITSSTAFVAGSPALNGNLTGGLSPVQNSLFLNMNNGARSEVSTTVIDLPTAVPGLQFRLHDVDFSSAATGFADKVTVTGTYNGASVAPILTNGVSNYVSGNVAIGDAGAVDTSANGNVVVTFNSPVDLVTIVYGNHTTAPADPGNQWMSIHDMSFCNAVATMSVSKISSVLSDGVSASNPKAIPGAIVQYCITIQNNGSGTTTAVSATDAVPADMTYVVGSMRTGNTCGTAAAVEDEDNSGADETPVGMSITGTTITGTATELAPNATLALVFNMTVN